MSSDDYFAGTDVGKELSDAISRYLPASRATALHVVPSRKASYAEWPSWLDPQVIDYFVENVGIARPYSHQVTCAESAFHGTDVVVATGTASGKSLGYLLPAFQHLLTDPMATVLYLAPTKALANNQLQHVEACTSAVSGLQSVFPATYDGDTPSSARRGIRDQSRFIISNPDMVHYSLLARHTQWTRFLRNLRMIVVDEAHIYRGVFGAHVSLVLRRLLRIAEHYGARPVIVVASATTREPQKLAQQLTGRRFVAVEEDGSPRGRRTIMLWEPGREEPEGYAARNVDDEDAEETSRTPAWVEAATMMTVAVGEGARVLTFTRSRRQAEVVALRTREMLELAGRRELGQRIAAYRGGYLAQDRRKLEHDIDTGALVGVATTNALELGVDIGGLDCVLVCGWPGTLASFHQQAGRAGRRAQSSLVVLVARDDPLDMYLIHHPEAIVGRAVEASVFNPSNPYILAAHLYCAAVEKPLTAFEVSFFGAEKTVAELVNLGLLRWRQERLCAVQRVGAISDGLPTPETAHAAVQLRGSGTRDITIVSTEDSAVLGTVSAAMAPAHVHPGAVYLHMGATYTIDALDFDSGIALAKPEMPDFSTYPNSTTDIWIVNDPQPHEIVNPSPGLWIAACDVEVIDRVTGYRRKHFGADNIETIPLELPAQSLYTRAVSYTLDQLVIDALNIPAADLPGALHAAEHAAIGLLPLIASCDRWDIGGVSTAAHPDTGLPTVFVYDGHPGGAGFADEGFARFNEWMTATYEAVRACPCEDGCPSCVVSPKCGNGNHPLHKHAAIKILGALVTMTT